MIVLGPARCQGCGELVVYAAGCACGRDTARHGALRWRDADNLRLHRCRARAREAWDNTRVGSSDESNRLANGARASATTGGAGVVLPHEVVAR